MSDSVLFSSRNIVVTPTLAKFSSQTFPINGIGSVSISAPNRSRKIVWGGLIALVSLPAISASFSGGNSSAGTVGFIFLLIAAELWRRAYFSPYTLIISTSSGDARAMQSRKSSDLVPIKDAIEKAATLRG